MPFTYCTLVFSFVIWVCLAPFATAAEQPLSEAHTPDGSKPLFSCRPSPPDCEPIALVNGLTVCREVYDDLLARKKSRIMKRLIVAGNIGIPPADREQRRNILERLLYEKAVESEAASLGISLGADGMAALRKKAEETIAQLEARLRKDPNPGSVFFDNFERTLSAEDEAAQACTAELWSRIVDARIGPIEMPAESEVRAYYDTHPLEFTRNEYLMIGKCRIAADPKAADRPAARQEARRTAEEFYRRAVEAQEPIDIVKGATLLNSLRPSARAKSGDCSAERRSGPEFEAAMKLEKGHLFPIVETEEGYEVRWVDLKFPAYVTPYDKARENIIRTLTEPAREKRRAAERKIVLKPAMEVYIPLPQYTRTDMPYHLSQGIVQGIVVRVPPSAEADIAPGDIKEFSPGTTGNPVKQTIGVDHAAVRDRPDFDGTVIGYLPVNSTVTVYEQRGAWAKIRVTRKDMRIGFIPARYLVTAPLTSEALIERVAVALRSGNADLAATLSEQALSAFQSSALAAQLASGPLPGNDVLREALQAKKRGWVLDSFLSTVSGQKEFNLAFCDGGRLVAAATFYPDAGVDLRLVQNVVLASKERPMGDTVKLISKAWFASRPSPSGTVVPAAPFFLEWPDYPRAQFTKNDHFLVSTRCPGPSRLYTTIPIFVPAAGGEKHLAAPALQALQEEQTVEWHIAGTARSVLIGLGPVKHEYSDRDGGGYITSEKLIMYDPAGSRYERQIEW